MELTMFGLRDGERMLLLNNGSLMELLKLSGIINGNLIHLIFKAMEDQTT